MSVYIEDAMVGAALAMSALILILSAIAYSRARERRLLLPLALSAAIAAHSAYRLYFAMSLDAPPGQYDMVISLIEIAVVIMLYAHWMTRGRRSRATDVKDGERRGA